MANNRMYLRCKTCGKAFFLGKTFGSGYHTSNIYYDGKKHMVLDNDKGEPDAFLRAFNSFLDKHAFCQEKPVDKDLEPKFVPRNTHYENQFEIAYEFFYEDDKEEEK